MNKLLKVFSSSRQKLFLCTLHYAKCLFSSQRTYGSLCSVSHAQSKVRRTFGGRGNEITTHNDDKQIHAEFTYLSTPPLFQNTKWHKQTVGIRYWGNCVESYQTWELQRTIPNVSVLCMHTKMINHMRRICYCNRCKMYHNRNRTKNNQSENVFFLSSIQTPSKPVHLLLYPYVSVSISVWSPRCIFPACHPQGSYRCLIITHPPCARHVFFNFPMNDSFQNVPEPP